MADMAAVSMVTHCQLKHVIIWVTQWEIPPYPGRNLELLCLLPKYSQDISMPIRWVPVMGNKLEKYLDSLHALPHVGHDSASGGYQTYPYVMP